MDTLAITLGGVVGSLYDPVVWLMICLVGWVAINKVSWVVPALIAAGFTAAQLAMVRQAWTLERGLWQFWFKLAICLAVFGIIRLVISAFQARTAA